MAQNGNDEINEMYDSEGHGEQTKTSKVASTAKNGGQIALDAFGRNVKRTFFSSIAKILAHPYVLAAIVVIVIIIILIIFLIGSVSFIFLGPAAIKDKVINMVNDWFRDKLGFFIGQAEAKVTSEQIISAAQYIDNMGYRLEGYGFGDVTRDESGKVTDIKSKYLLAYLAAENKTYMIANENFNLKDMFENITDLDEGTWGSGMLVINTKLWETTPNVKINREKKTLDIYERTKKDDNTKIVYRYDLTGWVGRYGKPLEFLLALHTGTMAPDFAYQVAVGSEFNTKVYIRFNKVQQKVKLKVKDGYYAGLYLISWEDDDGVYHQGIDKWVEEYTEKQKSAWQKFNRECDETQHPEMKVNVEEKVSEEMRSVFGANMNDINNAKDYEEKNTRISYQPYIKAVTAHWFRDLDFTNSYLKKEKNTVKNDGDYNGYTIEKITSGEIYQYKEPMIVGQDHTEDWENVVNNDKVKNDNSNSNTSETPTTVKTAIVQANNKASNSESTKNQDTASQNDKNNDSSGSANKNNKVTINPNEYEGYKLDNLFKETYQIANGLTGVSDEKKKIEAMNSMKYAITILENVKSEDAQYILRDLKRYLSKRGFTFSNQYVISDPATAELEYKDDRNLEYGGTAYTDTRYLFGSVANRQNGTTKKYPLGSIFENQTGGIDISEDGYVVTLHHKSANNTDGFETGSTVKAPGDGEVVNNLGNAIKIKISTKGAEGKVVTISGFSVDSSIKQGQKIKKGDKLGVTADTDITITMVDEKGNKVKPGDYIPLISAAESDVDLLARLIQCEDGSSTQGQAAVAWVIIHRLATGTWGNTLYDVIYAAGQFEPTWSQNNNIKNCVPTAQSLNIARNCLQGTMADPLDGKWSTPSMYFLSRRNSGWGNYSDSQIEAAGCAIVGGNVFSDTYAKQRN